LSLFKLPKAYNNNGTLHSHFVYILICQDPPGPLYIKIGMTQDVQKRFSVLRGNCPIPTVTLAWISLASKNKAQSLEAKLLETVNFWFQTGEWIKIEDENEFPDFKLRCNNVLKTFNSPHRPPLQWTHVDTQALIEYGKQCQSRYLQKLKSRGWAYKDFISHGGEAVPVFRTKMVLQNSG
jgi:hypothetical protein